MGALPDLRPSSTHCPSWRLSPHGRRRQPPLPWQRAAAHRRAPPSPSSATTTHAGPPPLHLQPPVVHATRRCAALHLAPASDLHNREPPRRWASIALDLRSLPCTSAEAGGLTPAPLFSASISASGRSSHRPQLKLTCSDVPCRPLSSFFISNLSSSLRSRLSLNRILPVVGRCSSCHGSTALVRSRASDRIHPFPSFDDASPCRIPTVHATDDASRTASPWGADSSTSDNSLGGSPSSSLAGTPANS